jgi:hypothetical protein
MSISLLSHERATEQSEPARVDPSSSAVTHAILRATGIVMLLGIALIHVVQLVPTFQQTPLLGLAYIMLIVAAVAVGAHLMRGTASPFLLWLPVVGLGLAVIGGYTFTRLFSTPLDNLDVGNWSCTLGMAALFVEGMLVAIATYAILHGRRVMLVTASAANGASHRALSEDEVAHGHRESAVWN